MAQHAPAMSARLRVGLVSAAIVTTVVLVAMAIALAVLLHPKGNPLPALVILLGALTYTGVGALVALKQPANRIGWLMLATGVVAAVALALPVQTKSLPLGVWAAWTFTWLIWLVLTALPLVVLLFPNGRPPSPRWWIPGGVLIGSGLLLLLLTMVQPGNLMLGPEKPRISNPAGLPLLAGVAKTLYTPIDRLYLLSVVACAAAPVWRWRRSDGVERQQLKLLAYVGSWIVVATALTYLPPVQGKGAASDVLWVLTMVGFTVGLPLAAAVAILRYRLYDIDVVINKMIVFAALAAFVVASYVLIVVGVGALIGTATQANLLLSAVATAAVALAFQPFRARAQALVDRLVFGRRANPNVVLSQISQMVAASSSTEQVFARLLELLSAATGATAGAIYRDVSGQHLLAARSPAGTVEVTGHVVSISHHGEPLGSLVLARSEPFAPSEERLLTDVGAQAGLLMHNLRLTTELEARVEELAESRRRIMAAQDAERRRLERDIHDGVQQQLIALMAKLRLARNQVSRQSELAAGTLDEVQADAGQLLDELRELASGIHPAVLTDGGIVAALRTRVDRLPINVVIEADAAIRLQRYSEAVEAAGYFIACEALANVLKHARASRAIVGIHASNHTLAISVTDDGRGFEPAAVKASGLLGLEDRVEALGGRLEIASSPGSGTTVAATLPIDG